MSGTHAGLLVLSPASPLRGGIEGGGSELFADAVACWNRRSPTPALPSRGREALTRNSVMVGFHV